MLSGIIGVPLGSYLSQLYSKKYPRCDPLICAFGLILSAPLMSGAMLTVSSNSTLTYVLIFFAELTLNLNWAVVADILLVSKFGSLKSLVKRHIHTYTYAHTIQNLFALLNVPSLN